MLCHESWFQDDIENQFHGGGGAGEVSIVIHELWQLVLVKFLTKISSSNSGLTTDLTKVADSQLDAS